MYYSQCIWHYKGNLCQNFKFILIWKMNKVMDKYIKTKNQGLIMLVMKIGGWNSQYLYK